MLIGADHKFKLCDFGSATDQVVQITNAASIVMAEEEIQKNTTLQYRAPEMVDLYQKRPIDERVDIWVRGSRGRHGLETTHARTRAPMAHRMEEAERGRQAADPTHAGRRRSAASCTSSATLRPRSTTPPSWPS